MLSAGHRHAEESRRALTQLKSMTDTLDGWKPTSEKKGVQLYERQNKESGVPPLVRGDCICPVTDISPLAFSSIVTMLGCRKIWDERFDTSEVKEFYSRYEALAWVKMKAPWPVTPRDFAVATIREASEDTCYASVVSVEDDMIPPRSDCVRGRLLCSGWKITRTSEGMQVTYVNQVDLGGSIPSSLLSSLMTQIPMCAGKVAEYGTTYRFPPLCLLGEGTTFGRESFDHATKTYEVTLTAQEHPGKANCLLSHRMYPTIKVAYVQGHADHSIEPVEGSSDKRVVFDNVQGNVTIRLTP